MDDMGYGSPDPLHQSADKPDVGELAGYLYLAVLAAAAIGGTVVGVLAVVGVI